MLTGMMKVPIKLQITRFPTLEEDIQGDGVIYQKIVHGADLKLEMTVTELSCQTTGLEKQRQKKNLPLCRIQMTNVTIHIRVLVGEETEEQLKKICLQGSGVLTHHQSPMLMSVNVEPNDAEDVHHQGAMMSVVEKDPGAIGDMTDVKDVTGAGVSEVQGL